jgi:hypothetical protein
MWMNLVLLLNAIKWKTTGRANKISIAESEYSGENTMYIFSSPYEYFELLLFPFHPLYTFGRYSVILGGFSKSSYVISL